VFALNVHASYACRHSGACCRAGWTIPVEPSRRSLIGVEWLLPEPDGACPQFDRPSGLCRVHRDHGEERLPESCYQFPRRALIDPRGTFVTLSHFCPTAAALLVDSEAPLAIVAQPPAFPSGRRYDGLDASGEWPPLLRPDALFDYDSFAAWERYLVHQLGSSAATVTTTLARLAAAAERLRAWRADTGPLLEWTTAVVGDDREDDPIALQRYAPFLTVDAYRRAVGAVPDGLSAPQLPHDYAEADAELIAPAWDRHARPVLRYLATKAFASWTAYQARGVRAQIAELCLAATVLRVECVRAARTHRHPLDRQVLVEAVRAADHLLVHLADRDRLTTWIGKADLDAAPTRVR
jgi:hypothetical protein